MLIRVKGYVAGIKDYLVHGQKSGRYFSRDELDERVPLGGDLDFVDNVITSMDSKGDRYTNYTLSFKEDYVSNEMLTAAVDEFIAYYFKGYSSDECCYYAEAHLPKIKSYNDSHGDLIERKPHIHIVVPRVNILTGEQISYQEKLTAQYRDAFQEYFNYKYGFASPKDNLRYKVNENSEYISRYKGDGFKGDGKVFRQSLLNDIIEHNIMSQDELKKFLEVSGYQIKVRNAKDLDKLYFNIIVDGEPINLRDNVFKNSFLNLDKKQKVDYLNKHEKIQLSNQYLEQGSNGNVPDKYLNLMCEWEENKSLYWRYARVLSKKEQAEFKQMNDGQKIAFLTQKHKTQQKINEQLKSENLTINKEVLTNEFRRVTTDTIRTNQDRIESLGRSISSATSYNGDDIRITGARQRRLQQGYKSHFGTDWLCQRGYSANIEPYPNLINNSQAGYFLKSSEVNLDETRNIDGQKKSARDLISNFNNQLDANILLELLAKTHGVNPEVYRITVNSNNQDKIGVGSRNLSNFDFCRKEINLSWRETINILDQALKMQDAIFRERGYDRGQRKYLWGNYQNWLKQQSLEVGSDLIKQDKRQKELIYSRYKASIKEVHKSKHLSASEKQQRLQSIKFAKALEFEHFNQKIKQHKIDLSKKHNKKLQDSYREFLVMHAETDQVALDELRRLRIDYNVYQETLCFAYVERYNEYRLDLKHEIDKNGIIHYKLDNNTILKDHGKWLESVKTKDEHLQIAIKLAQEKFGSKLHLRGNENYRQKVVDYVLKNNIKVEFIDEFSKKYHAERIAQCNDSMELLEQNKSSLLRDNPQRLNISAIEDVELLHNNKLINTKKIQVVDAITKQKYWITGYQASFKAKDLELGTPVFCRYKNQTKEIELEVKPEYQLKKQIRNESVAKLRHEYTTGLRSKYENLAPKCLYFGRYLKSGQNKKSSWVLLKTDDGKLVKINDLPLYNQLKNSTPGDHVCVAHIKTEQVPKLVSEKVYLVNAIDTNHQQELINELRTNNKLVGKILQLSIFSYSDGTPAARILVRDVALGKNQVIFIKNPPKLNKGEFAAFELNKNVWSLSIKLPELQHNDSSKFFGTVIDHGYTQIRGKDVFYCKFKTIDGEMYRYGENIRKLVNSGELSIGKHYELHTVEQQKSIMEPRELFDAKNIAQEINTITDDVLINRNEFHR
ncbi:MAG: hypothetical protein K2Q03_01540 [Sphingobacteriaceae bacterium]|nr:hypothetical protein [Sphingobacteriaceae bacterium]